MMQDILIREENYAADMERIVVPYLQARGSDGYFSGYDGNPIHYLRYRADCEKGAVIICHGFTESCRKYDELSYYFLQNDYSVWIPDHRGHGQSYRKLSDLTLTHIDHFEEYVTDLELLIDETVKKATTAPLFLFAHSMGGAIGALYMEKHPAVFRKAVLTSPMIAPSSGRIPVWIGKAITQWCKLIGKGNKRAFISGEYPGFEKFENSCATSRARFDYYERKKRSTNYLQNYSPTYSWICESIGVTKKILRKGMPERVQTPVRIFSAGNDTVVERVPQQKFADRLKNAEFKQIPNAKHEIFLSGDEILESYLREVLGFFED